jgi:hypothetical protein
MSQYLRYVFYPLPNKSFSQKRGEKVGEEIQIREKDFEKQGKVQASAAPLEFYTVNKEVKLFLPHC